MRRFSKISRPSFAAFLALPNCSCRAFKVNSFFWKIRNINHMYSKTSIEIRCACDGCMVVLTFCRNGSAGRGFDLAQVQGDRARHSTVDGNFHHQTRNSHRVWLHVLNKRALYRSCWMATTVTARSAVNAAQRARQRRRRRTALAAIRPGAAATNAAATRPRTLRLRSKRVVVLPARSTHSGQAQSFQLTFIELQLRLAIALDYLPAQRLRLRDLILDCFC